MRTLDLHGRRGDPSPGDAGGEAKAGRRGVLEVRRGGATQASAFAAPRTGRHFCRAGLVALCFLVSPVWAAPDDVKRARELSREAAVAFLAKNFEAALTKFREANRLVPHPNLDVNIGRCYEALGQPDQAMVHCKIGLNAPGVPDATRQAARQCVDRVTAALARPVFQITSSPPGAHVRMDGRAVGRTPWKGTAQSGRRQIDLELDGFRTESRSVNAESGQTYEVTIVLSRASVGGVISVTSVPPGASILLDGDVVGTAPLRSFQVDARSYVLELALPGFERHVSRITVEDGRTLERAITLIPQEGVGTSKGMVRWPGWALVGVGAAAVGAGGFFGYQALQTNDEADELARTSNVGVDKPGYDELDDRWRSEALAADIFYIAGGAAITGGITWLLWPDKPAKK